MGSATENSMVCLASNIGMQNILWSGEMFNLESLYCTRVNTIVELVLRMKYYQ